MGHAVVFVQQTRSTSFSRRRRGRAQAAAAIHRRAALDLSNGAIGNALHKPIQLHGRADRENQPARIQLRESVRVPRPRADIRNLANPVSLHRQHGEKILYFHGSSEVVRCCYVTRIHPAMILSNYRVIRQPAGGSRLARITTRARDGCFATTNPDQESIQCPPVLTFPNLA